MRVGVDVGGTFTDFVVISDGEMRVFKVPSTPGAPEQAVVDGLRADGITSAAAIVHGSTVATNALLERRGLTLALVLSDSDTTRNSAQALQVLTEGNSHSESLVQAQIPDVQETAPVNPEETGTQGTLFRRTLRSGRTIHSEGHVVIFGDVNPGAKVIAVGDIVIWGKLRGFVHAGVNGDESAIVCALDMSPSQLRIAGFVVTSPPDKRKKIVPEVALVRKNQIIVEARD